MLLCDDFKDFKGGAMKEQPISKLTVEQLQKLIRQTVQEAVAEVMMEFTLAAEIEAEITARAEMTDYLRTFLHDKGFTTQEVDYVELDD